MLSMGFGMLNVTVFHDNFENYININIFSLFLVCVFMTTLS